MSNTTRYIDLSRVSPNSDIHGISEIRYSHDPVPTCPSFINQPVFSFPAHRASLKKSTNGVGRRLLPLAAGLPFRCSLSAVHETRYWRQGLDASIKLLELVANDQNAADIEVDGGLTLAKLARHELRPGIEDRFNKATLYMYPFCIDQKRIELLASMMVMQFIFDDKAEETSDSTYNLFCQDFTRRLDNVDSKSLNDTPLQSHIDTVIQGYRRADAETGTDGGAEVVRIMRTAFTAVHLEETPRSIGEYLKFRHDNVGAPFVLACVKFSIASGVDLWQPKLAALHDLAMDHLGLVNDLYSFDKELRDFKTGKSKELINIVATIKDVLSLDSWDAAKEHTYSFQLQREQWIANEVARLDAANELDPETWRYIEALMACLAGNTFYSMTSSRYGGEAAAITNASRAVQWEQIEQDAAPRIAASAPAQSCVAASVATTGKASLWNVSSLLRSFWVG